MALMASLSADIPLGGIAYLAVLVPFLVGSAWLVLVGILVNNLSTRRQYPKHWL